MGRRIFAILSAVSLLLFLVMTIALSVGLPAIGWCGPQPSGWQTYDLESRRGTIVLKAQRYEGGYHWREGWHFNLRGGSVFTHSLEFGSPAPTGSVWHWMGFAAVSSSISPQHYSYTRISCRAIFVPMWALCVAAAILPFWSLGAWVTTQGRRRRRGRAGLCLVCGYDLRASPVRCPECGTPKPAQVESQR